MEKKEIFLFKVLMFSADVRKHKTRKIDVTDIDILCTTFRVFVTVVSESILTVIRTILINVQKKVGILQAGLILAFFLGPRMTDICAEHY